MDSGGNPVNQVLDMSAGDEVLGWTVSLNEASDSGSATGGSGSGDVIETGDVTYTNADGETRTYAEMVAAGWTPMTTGDYDFPALYSAGKEGVHQVLDMEEGDEVLGWTVSTNPVSYTHLRAHET